MRDGDGKSLIAFCGPSIYYAPRVPRGVTLRSPIQSGDLTNLLQTLSEPSRVLIVDGIFGQGQAVNLSEIRQFIGQGHKLYGSTSMGALRAVEAGPIGMVGVGSIFSEYQDGSRWKDSDVAVLHTEAGEPLTVPFVNAQRLCQLLIKMRVDKRQVRAFGNELASMHYTQRSFEAVRAEGAKHCSNNEADLDLLLSPEYRHRWDVKEKDALASLALLIKTDVQQEGAALPLPPVPRFFSNLLERQEAH